MPSTGIHLLVAHTLKPNASEYYWIGNFAPDYSNSKEVRNNLHLRNTVDHWDALEKLYLQIDKNNDFDIGWFTHLFVDTCWDEIEQNEHKNWFMSLNLDDNWYAHYREEIGIISYYLYNNLPWSKNIWKIIEKSQINKIITSLSFSVPELEEYRDQIVNKHSESSSEQIPTFFSLNDIINLTNNIAEKFNNWIKKDFTQPNKR